MDYKLALQLKKVGYPQESGKYYWKPNGGKKHLSITDVEDPDYDLYAVEPYLEELIDECGDKIQTITRCIHRKYGKGWVALGNEPLLKYIEDERFGKIPTEAVSKLYIKLNENTK